MLQPLFTTGTHYPGYPVLPVDTPVESPLGIKLEADDKELNLNLPPTFYQVPRRPLTRSATSQLTHSNPPPTEDPRRSQPPTEDPKLECDLISTDSPPSSSETLDSVDQAMDEDEFSGLQIVTAAIVVPTVTTAETDSLYCVTAPTFKLPSSKSPIMEAMVYCALHKWGIEITHNDKSTQRIVFKVTDFENYYKLSCSICSKQTPSEDVRSRMKALQRWFTSFPSRKDLQQPFTLSVKLRQFRKVREIIDKVTKFKAASARKQAVGDL